MVQLIQNYDESKIWSKFELCSRNFWSASEFEFISNLGLIAIVNQLNHENLSVIYISNSIEYCIRPNFIVSNDIKLILINSYNWNKAQFTIIILTQDSPYWGSKNLALVKYANFQYNSNCSFSYIFYRHWWSQESLATVQCVKCFFI